MELYEFQEKWVNYATNHHYCVNGDQMGLGKTIQAIALAEQQAENILIVCPAYLKLNWQAEVDKFGAEKNYDYVSYSSLKNVVNKFARADMIIADEAHYLKNMDAKRTRHFHEFVLKCTPHRLVLLSGTPIQNGVSEFYSLILLCSYNPSNTSGEDIRKYFKSQWTFNKTFCNMTQFRVKGRTITKFSGMKRKDELKRLLKGKYTRRLASEVLELPKIVRKNVMIRNKENPELKEAWTQFEMGFKDAHLMKSKAESAMLKAEFTAKYVKDLVEQGEQVVVFTAHLAPVPILIECLRKVCAVSVITGEVKSDNRHRIVKGFQEGEYKVLIATIGSASTGFTLTAARHLVFNDLDWVPANNAQAEKRIHRIGQEEKCVIHYIFGSKVDEVIGNSLRAKQEVLDQVLGGQ